MLHKNKHYEVDITAISQTGNGIGKLAEKLIYVPQALPGERVKFKLIKLDKHKGIGKLIEIKSSASFRIEPACELAKSCGGCQFQHINYTEQLTIKRNTLEAILKPKLPIEIISDEKHTYYRNKLQFSFQVKDNKWALGLYKTHSKTVVDTPHCLTASKEINYGLTLIRKWLTSADINLPLAHLNIRQGKANELMIIIICSQPPGNKLNSLFENLKKEDCIKSIYLNINNQSDTHNLGLDMTLINGKKAISAECLGIQYNIQPGTFTQSHIRMTDKLYLAVIEQVEKTETIWDLYCGIGVLSQLLAKKVKTVVGVELNDNAIECAKRSSLRNKLTNIQFFAENVATFLKKTRDTPDTIIINPPRNGCEVAVIDTISQTTCNKIIYISCSPKTLSRDLKLFNKHGFFSDKITAFDCFPHTSHLETIVTLKR